MTDLPQETPVQISLPALRISQPIGDFFIGIMPARELTRICDFDIRRLHKKAGIDEYLGIQREIDPKRIKQLLKYVGTVDATFPTAVIIAVDERCADIEYVCAEVSDRICKLTLRNIPAAKSVVVEDGEAIEPDPVLFRQIARVLDGQHRVKALMDSGKADFDINVAIFIGSDIATQAGIFSTVNLAQTKVNKSLVYDLFSYNRSRSPEKTCHEIAVVLDRDAESPFYQRIKRLGVATEGRFYETLSQATFVKALMPYISNDPIGDRDLGKRGKSFARSEPSRRNKEVFRDFFVEDRDAELTKLVWDYFDVVREKWPKAWDHTGSGRILNKTTGFDALMRFLRAAYLDITTPGSTVRKEAFARIFSSVTLTDDDFSPNRYIPGSSGTGQLYRDLLSMSGVQRP